MNDFLDTYAENKTCNPVAPLVSSGESECVNAGGVPKPPLSPFMGGVTCNSPLGCRLQVAPPKDPLSVPLPERVIRIPLTSEQTAQLAAAGAGAFSIISRRSYPDDPSRWIVTVAPASWDRAVAASGVLLGTHRAAKIKTPSAFHKP